MKYSIFGYEQKELANYNIDCVDLVLLDYLLYKCLNNNLEYVIVDNNKYVRITSGLILEDLPFLRLKERGISNRIDNLTSLGFIDKKQKYNEENVKKSYLRITEKINTLKFEDGYSNQSFINFENENKVEIKTKEIYPFEEIVDYLNKKCNTNYRASGKMTRKFICARFNEKFTLKDFKKVIDNMSKAWLKTDMEKYLRPETLFGNKFESYLNYKSKNKNNIYTPHYQQSENYVMPDVFKECD